jgi:hypothetical protein
MPTPLSDALGRVRDYVSTNDTTRRIRFEIAANGDWVWSSGKTSVRVDLAPDMDGLLVHFKTADGKVDSRLFLVKSSFNFSIESRVGCRILTHLGSGVPERDQTIMDVDADVH